MSTAVLEWQDDGIVERPSCVACRDYLAQEEGLFYACESVGIERGLDAIELLKIFLSDFHRRGHPSR